MRGWGRGRGSVPFPCFSAIEIFLLGQRQHPQLPGIKTGEGKLSEVDGKPTLIDRQQADAFPPQHLTEKHLVLLPTDLALVMIMSDA